MGKREDDRNKSLHNITQTALKLFAKEGYHTTSMSKIAKAAGISKGLIYNYFDSKDALLEAIVMQAYEIGEEMTNRSFQEDSPEKIMRKIIDEIFQVLQSDSAYWSFFFNLIMQPGILKSIKQRMRDKMTESINHVTQIMEQLGSKNPRIDGLMFVATCDGILLHTMAIDEYPAEEMKERLENIFINILPEYSK